MNQVSLDDATGQGSFEGSLLSALFRRVDHDPSAEIVLFTIRPPGSWTSGHRRDPRIVRLTLDKGSYGSYLAHQASLFRLLAREIRRRRGQEVAIYARYSASMWAPALAADLYRKPLTFRTGPVLPNLRRYGKARNPAVRGAVAAMFGFHCRVARRIVVVTPRIGRWVAEACPPAVGKIRVIHNGVDVSIMRPVHPDRTRWGLPPSGFVLGFVGTLYEAQGLDIVIRALGRLRREGGAAPHLLVVGDGPTLEAWKSLASQCGLDGQVVWAGRRPHEEIPSAIASCDVLLMPMPQWSWELTGSSSLKLFEYLACDKPVLASRGDDHLFLEREGLGWLVPPDDEAAWAEAIRRRMAAAGDFRPGRARAYVSGEYSYDVVAERIWSACFEPAEGDAGRAAGGRG